MQAFRSPAIVAVNDEQIRVHAHDGVEDLSGVIPNDRERLAAHVVAKNARGVTSVVDQLVWVEPTSGIVIRPADDNTAGLDASPPQAKWHCL